MPEAAIARLRHGLSEANCYLEYGSGGSTVMANELNTPVTISVESDAAWLDTLQRQIGLSQGALRLFIHADIGPTIEWGNPASDSHWRKWHKYPLSGWEACRENSVSPDLILIDGRFRKACFFASLIFGKPGAKILFDDYQSREFYHGVERFLKPVSFHERMAEFKIPNCIDSDELWLAFSEAVTDQR